MDVDRAALLAAMSSDLLAKGEEQSTLRAAVHHAVELVDDATSASITLQTRPQEFRTLASSSDQAHLADELQYSLHEGPCLDAASEGGWTRSGAVNLDRRWPRWGPEAAKLGHQSLLSVHLLLKGESRGAINLYSTRSGAFSDSDLIDTAVVFSSHLAAAVAITHKIEGLETALSSRHTIGLAQGILMNKYDISADQAFALLARYSSTSNVKIRSLAADVVVHRGLPAASSSPQTGADPDT